MKIIIVGGGISGLSTYLSFKKYLKTGTHDITIYEKHHSQLNISTNQIDDNALSFEELSSSTAIVGGGLGVSPNGMRLLKELSQELHDAVEKQGSPCERFAFKSSRGWNLSQQPTGDKRIEDGEEVCVATSRHGLWQCLRDSVAGEGDVLKYRKVVDVSVMEEGAKPKVIFENGEDEEADLIIGADGVRSVVKKSIFGTEKDGGEKFAPVYEGLLGVGGFVLTSSIPPHPIPKAMTFIFGPNGFFGYSPASPTDSMWWSTFNAQSPPESTRISLADMRTQLKARHATWKDPIIQAIIAKADVESVYPVWTTPELPYWGKDSCVLVGDAAHALQPTSGQGSSQALEDAKTLALCLEKFLGQVVEGSDSNDGTALTKALELSMKVYYKARQPRIDKIVQRTKLMSNRKKEHGFAEEMMTCFFLWLVGVVPFIGKLLLGDTHKELYHWDVNQEIEQVVAKSASTES